MVRKRCTPHGSRSLVRAPIPRRQVAESTRGAVPMPPTMAVPTFIEVPVWVQLARCRALTMTSLLVNYSELLVHLCLTALLRPL